MSSTIELFSGTQSFAKVARARGHDVTTVDIDDTFKPDIIADFRDVSPYGYRFVWASPPCDAWSVTNIGRNWYHDHTPKTQAAADSLALLRDLVAWIARGKPQAWAIENPRGKMRRVIDDIFREHGIAFKRETVAYCQYGFDRQKPTDIWTNVMTWEPRPMCARGSPCHAAAPRGSTTGTQGRGDKWERGKVPPNLIAEIMEAAGL